MDVSSLVEVKKNTQIPDFRPGDTVKVSARIVEGGKERLQAFQGVVIKIKRGGNGASFTVRHVAFGIGVERTFPFNSPLVEKVEIIRQGKVRRSRLYYLRGLSGKEARRKIKRVERKARQIGEELLQPQPEEEMEVIPAAEPVAAAPTATEKPAETAKAIEAEPVAAAEPETAPAAEQVAAAPAETEKPVETAPAVEAEPAAIEPETAPAAEQAAAAPAEADKPVETAPAAEAEPAAAEIETAPAAEPVAAAPAETEKPVETAPAAEPEPPAMEKEEEPEPKEEKPEA